MILAAVVFASAVVRDGRVASIENPHAVFRMASLSKVVTTIAALQLVHERRLGLHDDIARYLDVPIRRYRGRRVTLHHLLTHTSGIEDALFGNVAPPGGPIPALHAHFTRRPPAFGRAPGEQVVYSNEGMALAGYIVERAAGVPFAEHVRRRIFEPLGMRSSSFAQPPPFRVVPSGADDVVLIQAPSAAMVSTATDMAALMLFLLGDDPVARQLRTPYGLFGDGRGLFHTGRSGHESVLYLVPGSGLGVFLVNEGGMDRRAFVESIAGRGAAALRPPLGGLKPAAPHRGIYRPILFPVRRVERLAELGSDAKVEGATLTLPPFAIGKKLALGAEYRATASGDRFVLTGPLTEPVTFVRIPWWASGRAQLAAAAVALLVVIAAAIRHRGVFLLFVVLLAAAPAVFALNYFPRDAQTRPFHVEESVGAAMAMLICAALAALATPFQAKSVLGRIASVASLALVAGMAHYNLLDPRDVFRPVHAEVRLVGLNDLDAKAVLQRAQLLEGLGFLQR